MVTLLQKESDYLHSELPITRISGIAFLIYYVLLLLSYIFVLLKCVLFFHIRLLATTTHDGLTIILTNLAVEYSHQHTQPIGFFVIYIGLGAWC